MVAAAPAWGAFIHTDARPLIFMLDTAEGSLERNLGGLLDGWERGLAIPDNAAATLSGVIGAYMLRVGDEAVAIQDRQWRRLEKKDVRSFRDERIAWVRKHGAALAVGLDETMRRRIASIIEAGLEAGVAPDKLRRLLAGDVPPLPGLAPKRRAELIARTELHNAAMWAQEREALGLAARGAHLMKSWTGTMDARIRRAHAKANGQTRQLNQDFIVGGARMSRPGDPRGGARNVIRCRCVCRYMPASYVAEDRQRRAADMVTVAKLGGPLRYQAEIARMTADMDPSLARVVDRAAREDAIWEASADALRAAQAAGDAAAQEAGN